MKVCVTVVSALLSVCSWPWLYWSVRLQTCCVLHISCIHGPLPGTQSQSVHFPPSLCSNSPSPSKPSLLKRSNAIHADHPVWLVLLLCVNVIRILLQANKWVLFATFVLAYLCFMHISDSAYTSTLQVTVRIIDDNGSIADWLNLDHHILYNLYRQCLAFIYIYS